MRVIAHSHRAIDVGPGAGEEGGRVAAAGPPRPRRAGAGEPDGAVPRAGAGVTEAGRRGLPATSVAFVGPVAFHELVVEHVVIALLL